jgi:hypothetical protein
LSVVLDRNAVLDHDSSVVDITEELLDTYRDATTPAPLRLPPPGKPVRLSFLNSPAQPILEVLSTMSKRRIEINGCLAERRFFFTVGPATLPELFHEVARQLDIDYVDNGTAIEARCRHFPYWGKAGAGEARLDFATARGTVVLAQGSCAGIKLFRIKPAGPWPKRGVEDQDVLTHVAGKSVCTDEGWLDAMRESKPGDLTIRRGGRELRL